MIKRVKYGLLILSCLVGICQKNNAIAQKAETIYGKNRVLKSNEYYLEQIDLWKKEIDKNPKDANAWYNYYRAVRNAYIKQDEEDTRQNKGNTRFNRLKTIVEEMEKQVPNSYEYNFVKWLNGNNNPDLFPFLERAHKLSPQSAEPIMSLIFYYEIEGNYVQRDEYIKKYYNLGEYSPGLLNYSYNLLSGLPKNTIIFTEGDKDTEAILLLQKGKQYRDDVRLLNVNLLLIDKYRERVFKELGVSRLEINPLLNEKNYQHFQRSIIEHVAKNQKDRPVHVAVTVSSPFIEEIRKKLYITGLSYLYSTVDIDYISQLKNNIEQLYALDYIKVYFPKDISFENVKSMNGNYLIPFSVLSKHYKITGDALKADYYKKLSENVATASGRQDECDEIFKEY